MWQYNEGPPESNLSWMHIQKKRSLLNNVRNLYIAKRENFYWLTMSTYQKQVQCFISHLYADYITMDL